MEKTAISLKELWEEFREQNPKVRIRDAARILGVSEAELLAASTGGTAIRLDGDFKELLKQAGTLGRVMALTRNDFCVHERKGIYEEVSFNNHVGLALGPDIDLRLFMSRWKCAFAVREGARRSLQFFDGEGTAVHKIYLTEDSDQDAFEKLAEQYRAADQEAPLLLKPVAPLPLNSEVPAQKTKPKEAEAVPDEAVRAFQTAWLELKDTHDFFGLLAKYKLNREKAMHIAPEGYALEINVVKLKRIFEKAAASELPVMVFTASPGCVQIHTGLVQRLVQTGPWFNVLDSDFNLHLKEDGIHSVWVVKKPTVDGIVTGVEVFDRHGALIMQVFGKRKPGIPEDENWRRLIKEMTASN